MKKKVVAILFLIQVMVSGQAFSARHFCPCGQMGFPVVKDQFFDVKGGVWTLTCTNSSDTGDFVWTYQPAGGPLKVLGRCVFVGGINYTWQILGADGNIRFWIHLVVDGGEDDGQPWDAILNIFDKEKCVKYRLGLNYIAGEWVESLGDRQILGPDDFERLDYDAGFEKLTEGLYPDPTPPFPAEYETRVTLESEVNDLGLRVYWDVGELDPELNPGDFILLSGRSTEDIISLDRRFVASDSAEGLLLAAVEQFSPATQDTVAVIVPSSDSTLARYAVVDLDALEFYSSFFEMQPDTPIDALDWSFNTDVSDMPGYAAAMGNIDLAGTVFVDGFESGDTSAWSF